MPFIILPFLAGAFVVHLFHNSVKHAAHIDRLHDHEARLAALEEVKK